MEVVRSFICTAASRSTNDVGGPTIQPLPLRFNSVKKHSYFHPLHSCIHYITFMPYTINLVYSILKVTLQIWGSEWFWIAKSTWDLNIWATWQELIACNYFCTSQVMKRLKNNQNIRKWARKFPKEFDSHKVKVTTVINKFFYNLSY